MKDLFSSLHTGNLQLTQQAFAAVAKCSPINPNSQMGRLGQALQSGDVGRAQQLAAAMREQKSAKTNVQINSPRAGASTLSQIQGHGPGMSDRNQERVGGIANAIAAGPIHYASLWI